MAAPDAPYDFFLNAPSGVQDLFSAADFADLDAFHARNPQLEKTALRPFDAYARELGIASLLVKDETSRYGLPAFKSLGARYALDRLRREGALGDTATVACASAGNHGRAVARCAREMQLPAHVYMAGDADAAAVAAIAREGAHVHQVRGSYDDAVREMAEDARREGWTIVSDTSWDGYTTIPRYIMLGYTHLMAECASQGGHDVDLLIAQGGVGGLVCGVAAGAARHLSPRPRILVAEPTSAECLMASARAGRPTSLPATPRTIMAGLRCADPSPVAIPTINALADAFMTVTDDDARGAMTALASGRGEDPVVHAGPSGACGVGALAALLREDAFAALREHLGVGRSSRVMVIVSEAANRA